MIKIKVYDVVCGENDYISSLLNESELTKEEIDDYINAEIANGSITIKEDVECKEHILLVYENKFDEDVKDYFNLCYQYDIVSYKYEVLTPNYSGHLMKHYETIKEDGETVQTFYLREDHYTDVASFSNRNPKIVFDNICKNYNLTEEDFWMSYLFDPTSPEIIKCDANQDKQVF